MSFFRDYLKQNGQVPDYKFDERDENWFVFALLSIRLGLRVVPWNFWPSPWKRLGPLVDDPLKKLTPSPELQQALKFVSTFQCFFVSKPPSYQKEIASFKEYFIPGFADSESKQKLIFESALPSFSTTPMETAKWETVREYFKSA